MKDKFFRKYLILSLLATIAFVLAGSFITKRSLQYLRSELSVEERRAHRDSDAPLYLGALVFTAIFSVFISLGVLLLFYRKKAEFARIVINDLKSGKLKSRFPIEKIDETTKLMIEFNHMADEIEGLVEKLGQSEATRKQLLQDLSHDLKTPLSGMQIVLENLISSDSTLSPEKRLKFLKTCHGESLYIGSLIEDLLFLSHVEEATFAIKKTPIDLMRILSEEVSHLSTLFANKNIELLNYSDKRLLLLGDETLLKRLFRNLISNAASFAKTKVLVEVSGIDKNSLQITIEDDGEGLPLDLIASYGERALTKGNTNHSGGRASHGLGSVISKKIVTLHGGDIYPQNKMKHEGKPLGTRIQLTLKA